MSEIKRPDVVTIDLLKRAGDRDPQVAKAGQYELAQAFEQPLREAVFSGDILSGVYNSVTLEPGSSPEYPMDLLNPGDEDDFVAYTNPGHGRIPERQVQGDYVTIHTYGITNSIDMLLRFARDANYDVVGRALQVMRAGFVKKMNDDGWRTLIGAAADRNILVYDADASVGQFTKRLISLLKVVMRRNGGGNTTSLRQRKLTDLYMSIEALEDIRNWGLDQVDDITRREIYTAADGGITRVFSVNLHDLAELGVGQQYQNFFTSALSGTMGPSDIEILLGLDTTGGNFVMPVREELKIFPDDGLHRFQKMGYYGWAELGFAALDNRDVILGSI